jgi:hypothetical protein
LRFMSLSRSLSPQRSEPTPSIPVGWYWLAALACSIFLWWAIIRVAVLATSALV